VKRATLRFFALTGPGLGAIDGGVIAKRFQWRLILPHKYPRCAAPDTIHEHA
jgi:hypothetical protein